MSQTQANQSGVSSQNRWAGNVAIVCEQAGGVCISIFRAENGALKLVDIVNLPTVDKGPIQSAIKRAKIDRVVGIVPSGQSMCRVEALPDDALDNETAQALVLLGEAQLPSRVPAHRRATGVFPSSFVADAGLLTGWMPGRERAVELADDSHSAHWSWISESACVAALAGVCGDGIAVAADGGTGTITGAVVGHGHGIVRSRVDTPNDGARVSDMMNQLAKAVGVGDSHASVCDRLASQIAGGLRCVVSPQARSSIGRMIGSAQIDDAWVASTGLSAGAALVALSTRDEVASLAEIRREPDAQRAGRIERCAALLTNPASAWTIAGVCALIALVAPLTLAYARTLVLTQKVERISIAEADYTELASQAAVYEHLKADRWPMTRLMSVVSRAAPVGVTVKSVRLSPDVGLRLSGEAENARMVNEFVSQLNTSKVFERARSSAIEVSSERGIEFELSAQVGNDPHRDMPKGYPDFSEESLAVRKYGEGASNTRWVGGSSSTNSNANSSRSVRSSARPSRTGTLASNDNEDGESDSRSVGERSLERPERGSEAAAPPAPKALTEEAISEMDAAAARTAFSKRVGYLGVNRSSLETETVDRLEDETQQLRDHIKSLRGGE